MRISNITCTQKSTINRSENLSTMIENKNELGASIIMAQDQTCDRDAVNMDAIEKNTNTSLFSNNINASLEQSRTTR